MYSPLVHPSLMPVFVARTVSCLRHIKKRKKNTGQGICLVSRSSGERLESESFFPLLHFIHILCKTFPGHGENLLTRTVIFFNLLRKV